MKKIYVIVPVFNEEKVLKSVLDDLTANKLWEVIVVNDGSNDNSRNICNNYNIKIIDHIVNSGQGAAIRTGINYSIQNNADIICTFDSDGQHRVDDLQNMINLMLENEKIDVVIGSRFINNVSKIPFRRKIALKFAVLFSKLVFGGNFTDVHNGLRVFTNNSARKINLVSNRMEHASLISESISKQNMRFVEMPVDIIYSEYSISKGQKLKDIIMMGFKLLLIKINEKRTIN